jgi:integrase
MAKTYEMAKTLTDIALQKLKPRADRYEVPDLGARGLRVIVQPSGCKSLAVRYRNAAGRARKLTLPAGISLAAARKFTADVMLEVAQGRDPATAKQVARRAARSQIDDTVERLAAQFLDLHARRQTRANTLRATEAAFRNSILPAWGPRSVHDIARRDVLDVLDGIAADRPAQANRTKAVMTKFFNWLASRDIIKASPCVGVATPSKEVARDRALNDDELRLLWRAAEAVGGNAEAYVKLLVLTGQRRSQIAELRWVEVGDDLLAFPAERMKGRLAHVVPLSTQAAAIIAGMPRVDDFVLGGALRWHLHNIKRKLDAHMGDVPEWRIHDIRRSVASGLAKIGTPLPVVERILAHKGQSFRGVAGVYQRHSFLPEMTIALQKWGDYLERLIGGEPASVVKLPQRR